MKEIEDLYMSENVLKIFPHIKEFWNTFEKHD